MPEAMWRNALLVYFVLSVCSQAVESQACGSLVNGAGLLQSINYPNVYIINHNCTWTLQASPANGHLHLQFLTFVLESGYDFVRIYDESDALIRTFTGQSLPPSLTLGSRATVVFTTDYSVVLMGFSIRVSTIAVESQACGSLVNGAGFLQSINYPNLYMNNHTCTWTLQASPANGHLCLQFLTFVLESGSDYVQIFDENQLLIRWYTGRLRPPSLTLGSRATVVFTTDLSVVYMGFSIGVSTIGPALVTFSRNPVYVGEPVTLTCSYGSGVALENVSLDAFNENFKEGSLWCSVPLASTAGQGVLLGNSFVDCPTVSAGSTTTSVSMVASQSLERSYNFSATVTNSYGDAIILTSSSVSLDVRVLPSTPRLWPSPLTFNENDNAAIVCDSPDGKPPAEVTLIISGTTRRESTAVGTVTVVLPLPLTDWHNAVATCSVTNHIFSSMTVSSDVTINFIKSIGIPPVVNTTASGAVLNCSSYISSFPGAYYQWSVSPQSGITNRSLLSSGICIVQQGQTGLINCTAMNVITMRNVSVVFNLSSLPPPSPFEVISSNSTCEQCWIIAPVAVRIVIFVVVFILLFKGLCSSKCCQLAAAKECKLNEDSAKHVHETSKPPASLYTVLRSLRVTSRNSSKSTHNKGNSGTLSSEQCNVTSTSLESVDHQYESLRAQLISEPTYAQLTNAQYLDDVVVYENVAYLNDNFQAN